MIKRTILLTITITVILLIFLGILCFIKADDNLIRIPVKRNVILDYNDIVFTDINVNNNYVSINGVLNTQEDQSLEQYTIENVETKKEKETLYITITGGYGTGEEFQKFVIDEHFDGEEIKKIILKGRRLSSKVVWEKEE